MRQFRQLPVVAGGQVAPDGTDVLVDHVIIVHQPSGGRRHGRRVARAADEGLVGLVEDRRVVLQPPLQRDARRRAGGHLLFSRQRLGEVFEPLDAEQFGGDWLVTGHLPQQRTPDAARAKIIQIHLGLGSGQRQLKGKYLQISCLALWHARRLARRHCAPRRK